MKATSAKLKNNTLTSQLGAITFGIGPLAADIPSQATKMTQGLTALGSNLAENALSIVQDKQKEVLEVGKGAESSLISMQHEMLRSVGDGVLIVEVAHSTAGKAKYHY